MFLGHSRHFCTTKDPARLSTRAIGCERLMHLLACHGQWVFLRLHYHCIHTACPTASASGALDRCAPRSASRVDVSRAWRNSPGPQQPSELLDCSRQPITKFTVTNTRSSMIDVSSLRIQLASARGCTQTGRQRAATGKVVAPQAEVACRMSRSGPLVGRACPKRSSMHGLSFRRPNPPTTSSAVWRADGLDLVPRERWGA